MNLTKNYMTNNRCYTRGRKIPIKKLVLHSLGCPQPDADVFVKSWNNQKSSKCVHAFIEADRVIQTLPWDYKGWHSGRGWKGSYNNCSVGVEICEPKGHTYKHGSTMIGYDVEKQKEYFEKVYNNSVELFAFLCKLFNLAPGDILCHSEVHKLGYGSNHGDVMHWFPKHGKSMDTFRADVGKRLGKEVYTKPTKTITPLSPMNDIKWLQSKYNAWLSYMCKTNHEAVYGLVPLKVDGKYGPKTRQAVIEFYKLQGWKSKGEYVGKFAIGRLDK